MCPKKHVSYNHFQVGIDATALISCTICAAIRPAEYMTIGAKDAQGCQAFACNTHLVSSQEWLFGWVSFLLGGEGMQETTQTRFLEIRRLRPSVTKMGDVALHLFLRYMFGAVVIVVNDPPRYLSVLRKNWLKLLRSLELERARTLDRSRRQAIERLMIEMEQLVFTFQAPTSVSRADVYLCSPHAVKNVLAAASTIFVCDPQSEQSCSTILQNAPTGSAVIVYEELQQVSTY